MLVSWGDDGKGFAWKYIIPNTKKKNKCRGSFHLSSNTDCAKSVPYGW